LELLVTGHAGESGSRRIYLNEETRKKLLDRYPQSFFVVLGESDSAETELSAMPGSPGTNDFSKLPGITDSESAREGGVLGALWRLLKRNRLGADYDQRQIPVLQQTIEICETFGLDPYRLEATSCRVYLCEDPGPLYQAARDFSVVCHRIGSSRKGPAIRRIDGAAVAYLRKPEP